MNTPIKETTTSPTSTAVSPMTSLSRALERLRNLGVAPGTVTTVPAVTLVNELQAVDADRATRLARVFQAEADFNELARNQTAGMAVGEAHAKIAGDFDSIVEDTRAIYNHLHDDGRIDFWEKLDIAKRTLMHGGTIPMRFNHVRAAFLDATKRCQEQLNREQTVVEAYATFRTAYSEGLVDALETQKACQANLEKVRAEGQKALADWEAEADAIEKARKAIARNTAVETVERAERLYQVATNLVNDMRVGQGAGDTIIEKLKQTHTAKIAVQDRAISFWGTNEHVITALCVALQSEKGLNERTESLQALQRGTEKAMDILAEIGTRVDRKAVETAYGASLSAESVGRLVDSMVTYQKESLQLIAECRAKADASAREIAARAAAGQSELGKIILQGTAPKS